MEPVGLEPLPSLSQTINDGVPQGRGPVPMLASREQALAVLGEQDARFSSRLEKSRSRCKRCRPGRNRSKPPSLALRHRWCNNQWPHRPL